MVATRKSKPANVLGGICFEGCKPDPSDVSEGSGDRGIRGNQIKLKILERGRSGMGFQGRKPGSIVDLDGGIASLWIELRYAEPVEELTFKAEPEYLVPQARKQERMKRK
jgi:hypothetical protein